MSEAVSSSMLKKLKDFLIGRKQDEITPSEAEKIQKASYAVSHTEIKENFSATYLTILPGLDSSEKQLFETSVYYLAQIAANKSKYHKEIVSILKKKANESKINPEFREYINQQLENILSKNNQ